jgi:hypothetical protein
VAPRYGDFVVTNENHKVHKAVKSGLDLCFGGLEFEATVGLVTPNDKDFKKGGRLEGGIEVGFVQTVEYYLEQNTYLDAGGHIRTETTRFPHRNLPIKDAHGPKGMFYGAHPILNMNHQSRDITMSDIPTTTPCTSHSKFGQLTLTDSTREQRFNLWICAYHKNSGVFISLKQYNWHIDATYTSSTNVFTKPRKTRINGVNYPLKVPVAILGAQKCANQKTSMSSKWS